MTRIACLCFALFAAAPAHAQDLSVGASAALEDAPSVDLRHADGLSAGATGLYGVSIANLAIAALGGAFMGYAFTTDDPGEEPGFTYLMSGLIMTSIGGFVGLALLIPAIVLDVESGNARRGSTTVSVGPGSLGLTTTF